MAYIIRKALSGDIFLRPDHICTLSLPKFKTNNETKQARSFSSEVKYKIFIYLSYKVAVLNGDSINCYITIDSETMFHFLIHLSDVRVDERQ